MDCYICLSLHSHLPLEPARFTSHSRGCFGQSWCLLLVCCALSLAPVLVRPVVMMGGAASCSTRRQEGWCPISLHRFDVVKHAQASIGCPTRSVWLLYVFVRHLKPLRSEFCMRRDSAKCSGARSTILSSSSLFECSWREVERKLG